MKSYSPYDNLEKHDYPAMLVTTSVNDSQVGYWEPAKYVARLRTLKTDKNELLLKVNMGAGHGGASGRYDKLKETAFEYAWLMAQVAVGKRDHLEPLIRRYASPLLTFIQRMVGDPHKSEDIFQEVFLAVFRRISTLR
jgi:hypothetical protein